jgi:hypothetical protein
MQPLPPLPLSTKCEIQKWITIPRSELALLERWTPPEHARKSAHTTADLCDVYRWLVIDVDEALRTSGAKRCVECRQTVKPHKASDKGVAAHFEHLKRNPNCSLSEVGKSKR